MTLTERAAKFARTAHKHQKRKYTFEPYFNHVEAVAKTVEAWGGDEATVAAAYLHDVLEDTDTKYQTLVEQFGNEVANLVVELTDVFTHQSYPKLNRKARKERETARLATVSDKAKMIKRADIADNTSDIVKNAPTNFVNVYLAEKDALMKVL